MRVRQRHALLLRRQLDLWFLHHHEIVVQSLCVVHGDRACRDRPSLEVALGQFYQADSRLELLNDVGVVRRSVAPVPAGANSSREGTSSSVRLKIASVELGARVLGNTFLLLQDKRLLGRRGAANPFLGRLRGLL